MNPSSQALLGLGLTLLGILLFHLKTPWLHRKVEALRDPIMEADRTGNTAEGLRLIRITKRWFWANRTLNFITVALCAIGTGTLLELVVRTMPMGVR